MLNLEIIGQGKTTTVYRDGNRAIKLYINAPPDEAYNEAKLQTFAVEAGLPVPPVYEVHALAQGVALEMRYIDGYPLLTASSTPDHWPAALDKLAELQCTVYQVDAQGLPRLTEKLARRYEHSPHLDPSRRDALLNRLHRLDRSKTNLCHGDFHVQNILREQDTYWIIDWVDATAGDPLADVCRSYLLFLQYFQPIAEHYLLLLCRRLDCHRDMVLDWLPLIAAGRLSESLSGQERSFLMDIIEKSERNTA